jgi:hypothetical protein
LDLLFFWGKWQRIHLALSYEASEEEWEWQLHQEREKCEELAVPSVNPRDPRGMG